VGKRKSHAKSISKHPSDNEEDFVQETPETTLVEAQAYLLTTQPEPADPREHMHQAAIRSLGLVEDKLRKHPPEEKATYHKEKQKRKFQAPTLARPNKRFIRRQKKVRHERRTQGTL
jgi:hypothetical protein